MNFHKPNITYVSTLKIISDPQENHGANDMSVKIPQYFLADSTSGRLISETAFWVYGTIVHRSSLVNHDSHARSVSENAFAVNTASLFSPKTEQIRLEAIEKSRVNLRRAHSPNEKLKFRVRLTGRYFLGCADSQRGAKLGDSLQLFNGREISF